jgi:uncharacterized protein
LKYGKQFIVPLAGTAVGSCQSDFHIDSRFFEQYPENEIQNCEIKVNLTLIRQEDSLLLVFGLSGKLGLICDRCLDPYDLEINDEESVLIKLGKKGEVSGDDECLPADVQEIDVRQYIYDLILLRIPFRRVHPDDESGQSQCDAEVLRKLEELSQKKDSDSRWDRLKDMQNN